MVNWLIEHQESLPTDDTDTDSVSSDDYGSSSDSTSDDFDDLDTSGEVCAACGFLFHYHSIYNSLAAGYINAAVCVSVHDINLNGV